MPRLTIQEAGEPVEYDILDPEVTIGRGAANAVQLTANGVSKHHAVLRRVRGRLKLVDLESLNGTVVNGRVLNQRWLMDGDLIRVGEATITYAADGIEQGPPVSKPARPKVVGAVPAQALPAKPVLAVKPAVGVKPVAAQPPPVPAQAAPARPAARAVPAAPLTPPPPPAAAAPAAPQAPTRSAPARSAPVRRRAAEDEYDDGYDDYGEERAGRRIPRKSNGPWIVMGVLGGVLVFGILIFMIFGATASNNRELLHEGITLARQSKYKEALALAEQQGDPDGRHYDLLRDEMDVWRQRVQSSDTQRLEDESREFWDKQILRKSWSPTLHPVDAMTEAQTVQRIHEWMDRYSGTLAVKLLVAGEDQTMQYYRQLLREHPDPEYTPHRASEEVRADVESLVSLRFYHQAIERLGDLEGIARLRMTREAWTELEARVRQWKSDILGKARTEVAADMRSARDLVAAEQRADAVRKLKTILRRYPRELVPDAPAMLEALQ